MLYSLEGQITEKGNDFVILKQGGISFKVFTTGENLNKLKPSKKETEFFCFLYFRQDHFELYGFLKKEELKFFELLNGISGIGPRTSLAILSIDKVEKIMVAILEKRIDFLTRASGLGRKGAERLILELQNKIQLKTTPALSKSLELDREVEEVLVNLGYSQVKVRQVLSELGAEFKTLEERLRQALKLLSRI